MKIKLPAPHLIFVTIVLGGVLVGALVTIARIIRSL